MTMFQTAVSICGLSNEEAAQFLQVPIEDIEGWLSGASRPPREAWIMISSLYEHVNEAADEAADRMEENQIDPMEGGEFEVDLPGDKLPFRSCRLMAGVIATLMMGLPNY